MKCISGKIAIAIQLIAGSFFYSNAQSGGLLQTANSPYVKLRNVDLGDVTWAPGFWGDKVAQCQSQMIPYLRQIYMERALLNFKIAAGMESGEFQGSWWHDGDFYKWVEALVVDYADTKNADAKKQIGEIVDIIQKAQEKDGYINTAIQIGHGKITSGFNNAVAFSDKKRWESEKEHEMYNFGHLFTLAAIHYRVTGEKSLLNVADKAADYIYSVFKQPTPQLAGLIFNPPQIMGLVELYRSTGNKKYLDMANLFLSMKGMMKEKRMQTQDHLPVRQQTEAIGHAVTGLYLYAGMADVYAETGDTALLLVIKSLWDDITEKKMYITGGVGSYHNNAIRGQQLVQEAFGKEYDLPNSTAYDETCANISNAMFSWRMLGITGDARYADVMEQVFYNSLLSSISLDGKSFFYTNPLRWYGKDHVLLSQDAYQRWNLPRGGICCPPNTIRTIAEMGNYAYSINDKGVWVNLYGSNRLQTKLPDSTAVMWEQQSDYPWKETVKLTCNGTAAKPYALMLRIPGWASNAAILINGKPATEKVIAGSYCSLSQTWKKGDVVELTLPMPARLVQANPKVEADVNQVAVERGPIVYCLESADAQGKKLDEIVVPATTRFTPQYRKDMLGGVTVLTGTVLSKPDVKVKSGSLYQPVSTAKSAPINITLVPYYAWNNRGIGEMEVWMPQNTQ